MLTIGSFSGAKISFRTSLCLASDNTPHVQQIWSHQPSTTTHFLSFLCTPTSLRSLVRRMQKSKQDLFNIGKSSSVRYENVYQQHVNMICNHHWAAQKRCHVVEEYMMVDHKQTYPFTTSLQLNKPTITTVHEHAVRTPTHLLKNR